MELGPRELPTFVSPAGDELAMQAFVLGEEANLDPEEDDSARAASASCRSRTVEDAGRLGVEHAGEQACRRRPGSRW